jgi:transcription initiation factor TFIID subunit 13
MTVERLAVKNLMYGFGDDYYGTPDSVSVMEDILIEYITSVVSTFISSSSSALPTNSIQCLTAAGPSKKARLQVEDLRRVFTRPPDHKKLARMEELLFMQEDIKRARQAFEDDRLPEPA